MNIFKRIIGAVSAVLLAVFISVPVSAVDSDNGSVTVTVRIEGIEGNFFSGDVSVKSDDGTVTLLEVLRKCDSDSEDFELTGLEKGHITSVRDVKNNTEDKEHKFNDTCGWYYLVNSIDYRLPYSECTVKDGGRVLLYYGDPDGEGVSFPVVSYSDGFAYVSDEKYIINDDKEVLDIVYTPIKGATLTLDGKTYTTDDEGKVDIGITYTDMIGLHSIQVEKTAQNGMPLVVRLNPQAKLAVDPPINSNDSPPAEKAGESGINTKVMIGIIAAAAVIIAFVVIIVARPRSDGSRSAAARRRRK